MKRHKLLFVEKRKPALDTGVKIDRKKVDKVKKNA
jgi:hypothetical protein